LSKMKALIKKTMEKKRNIQIQKRKVRNKIKE
jgi:hypothetical protein